MEHQPADGDAELLRRFAAGDGDALGLLASRYEPSLLGIARGLLARDEHAARDAVQECWMRVIRHAARFRGECSVHTWIYRILVNRCLDRRAADRSGTGAKQRDTDASGSGGSRGGGGGEGVGGGRS